MRYRRSIFKLKLRKQTIYSIFSLGIFALSGLIVAGTFMPEGRVLNRVNEIFSNYFGWGRLLFVFTFIQLGLLFARVKTGFAKGNTIIGYFLITTALLSLSQTGTYGAGIFQTIYALTPVNIVVFFILLIAALLGGTMLFNLSIGEVVTLIQESFGAIKGFLQKLFSFRKKTIAPVFVKDNMA